MVVGQSEVFKLTDGFLDTSEHYSVRANLELQTLLYLCGMHRPNVILVYMELHHPFPSC